MVMILGKNPLSEWGDRQPTNPPSPSHRSLLPSGDFLAHLFFECANDGLAIEGNFQEPKPPVSTPEPSSMLALALLGGTFALKRRFS